jgi:hypothetical protein
MQLVADLIDAFLRSAGDFTTAWWPSLLLFAIAVPLLHDRKLRIVAPSPATGYVLIALLALAFAAVRTIAFGAPHPVWFTDDFGYLLEADTFVHGRLANPMHPMHRYFETLFVLQTPTYSGVYPPGVPLILALGRVLFGSPVIGLWIASAAAAVALSWAAGAVASREVAWTIGVFCAVHPFIVQGPATIHNATLPATAGALAIGGALRLPRVSAAVWMGVGLALLANTRPYEGLYVAIVACALAIRKPRALAIAIVTTIALLGFTLMHNRAVTGSITQFPYTTYNARYLSAPNLIWEKPFPPRDYPTPEMEHTYRILRHYYERSRHWRDVVTSIPIRIQQMLSDSLGFGVDWVDALRLFAALPFFFGLRQRRIVLAILFFTAGVLQITWWPQPQYLAPGAVLMAILYAAGMQSMIDRGESALSYACLFVLIGSALVIFHASMGQIPMRDENRLRTTEVLDARPGPQLVIADDRCDAVVFNGADVDAQHTVWAHGAPDGTFALLDYYRDRDVWTLDCKPYSLQHIRSPREPPKRSTYERDIFYPYKFPGRMRQSSP